MRPIFAMVREGDQLSGSDAFDASIGNAVIVSNWMHHALTIGNVNRGHYWWLQNPYNETNEGWMGRPGAPTTPTKWLYSFGNDSKFVRPGWTRIDAAGSNSNVLTSA